MIPAAFNDWWLRAPHLEMGNSGTFAAWWRGTVVLHTAVTTSTVTSSKAGLAVEFSRSARSSDARLLVEYRPLDLVFVASPDLALPVEIIGGIHGPRAASMLLEWITRLEGPRARLALETRLRVRAGRAPLSIEINGRNVFELLLAWNEYRPLDQDFFLIWNETSLGLDQSFLLDWIEKDLLGALELTWREIPAGMTDLLGQVQRPYGRATKTPNP